MSWASRMFLWQAVLSFLYRRVSRAFLDLFVFMKAWFFCRVSLLDFVSIQGLVTLDLVVLSGTLLSNMVSNGSLNVSDKVSIPSSWVERRMSVIRVASCFILARSALSHRYIFRRTGFDLCGLVCVSKRTASWSPIPGISLLLLTSDGWLVKKRSSMFFPLVEASTNCSTPHCPGILR